MECSRGTFDLARQYQTVLAASQSSKLELQTGLSGACDYFTLNANNFKDDGCEIEILTLFGRTNFKVITDTVGDLSPTIGLFLIVES